MSRHKERAEERAKHSDPINFTCGGCRKVIEYDKDYVCPECEYGKDKISAEEPAEKE